MANYKNFMRIDISFNANSPPESPESKTSKQMTMNKLVAHISLECMPDFDSVDHLTLIQKLQDMGLPPYLTRLKRSFLCNRTYTTHVGNSMSFPASLTC